MTPVLLEVAKAEHLSQIAELEILLNPHAPWSISMLSQSISAGAQAWILTDQDRVLGYLVCDRTFEVTQILAIGVDPKHQRRGLARRLLVHHADRQREAGAARVLLEVAATNLPAKALYERLGYAQVGVRRGYYRGLHRAEPIDALVLQRLL